MSDRGLFVVIEGGDRVGKSTQVRALAAALELSGVDHVITHEPGGTPGRRSCATSSTVCPAEVGPMSPGPCIQPGSTSAAAIQRFFRFTEGFTLSADIMFGKNAFHFNIKRGMCQFFFLSF